MQAFYDALVPQLLSHPLHNGRHFAGHIGHGGFPAGRFTLRFFHWHMTVPTFLGEVNSTLIIQDPFNI